MGDYRLLLEASAKAYLAVWGDLLQASERERILSLEDPEQVLMLEIMAKRVELTVEEQFVGEPHDRVIVGTGFGDGDCGTPFEEDGTYVVVATKGRGGVYYTGYCSLTAPADREPQALAALRAWKKGEEFPRTVFGRVMDWTTRDEDWKQFSPLAGQAVRLVGPSQAFDITTDSNGYFEWSDLPAGRYELEVARPGWTMTSRGNVDMTSNRCVSMFVTLEQESEPDRGLP